MSPLIFNSAENSDDFNLKWGNWPLFISQSLAPIMLLFFGPLDVVIGVLFANFAWAAIRHSFVSITLANWGAHFATLKWLICPATAIYLYLHGEHTRGILALIWPFLVLIAPMAPGARFGAIESLFMKKLGYASPEV